MYKEKLKHIESLLAEKQWDSAQKELELLFAEPGFMDAFAGGAYVDAATCYLAAVKSANQEYGDVLDAELTVLKAIDKREPKAKEEIDLARLDGEIKRLQDKS